MKRIPFRLALIVVAATLSGCIVQSFNAFYTESSEVDPPALEGNWKVAREWGESGKTNVWTFEKGQFVTVDEDGRTGQVQVTFFKLGETMFCDSRAGDLDRASKPNWQWLWHVIPVHTVSRVKIEKDRLEFRPLDLGWTTNHAASLPHVRRATDGGLLYTATAAQWEVFLKEHANNTNAFPDTHVYILERTK